MDEAREEDNTHAGLGWILFLFFILPCLLILGFHIYVSAALVMD
jgi:hypothetical protein